MTNKLPVLARIGQAVAKAFGRGAEGSQRGPFFGVGELGSWFKIGTNEDGWQRNLKRFGRSAANVPIVYGCVMAQSRAVSACYAKHIKITKDGKHEQVFDSQVAKLLRRPNGYETWPQHILNVVSALLFEGEAGVLLIQDKGGVTQSMHRVTKGSWQPYVEPQTGEIFYGVSKSGNPCIPGEVDMLIPARQFIHFRQHTPRHPLIGETALTAAMLSIGVNVALSESQAQFFSQMRRPSGVLTTDTILTAAQIKQLRTAFDEQAADIDQGGIPILGGGLKFSQMAISSQDAEVINTQRMTNEDVCRVYGVPPPIVADLTHATLTNAETLINHWLSIGLGSLLENLERSYDLAFNLPPEQYIELDTTALLRTDFMQRVEGWVKGIQGGLYAANEARAEEGLPPVPGGNNVMVQQQMVTLEFAASQKLEPPTPPAPAEPDPAPEPDAEDKNFNPVVAKALLFERLTKGKAA